MLSRKHNFLFVHIPKTGGNSLQTLLEPYSEDRRLSKHAGQDLHDRFDVQGAVTKSKHQIAALYLERLGEETFKSLFKLAFVRNPYDRAMSYYFSPNRWIVRKGDEILQETPIFERESFAASLIRLRPMVDYLKIGEAPHGMDFLGRFERFESDVAAVLAKLGIERPAEQLPHVNRSSVSDHRRFYDQATAKLVRDRFGPDFDAFGYALDAPA